MIQLPTELWLMIFDIVIEEGIIRVDQCDHTKFPYIQSILAAPYLRYRAYDSYYRLCLVCRTFKAILGDPPQQILSPSSIFPLSAAIRAVTLDFHSWPRTDFQLLSAETLSCQRVVHLSVACGLRSSSHRPNLSDFLNACTGRAFHNVQRLTLRLVNNTGAPHKESSFWVRLHDAFPLLVTLVITQENPDDGYIMLDAADTVASFEWLEILYLGRAIEYAGCRISRLRHASVWSCSRGEREILELSPHLESLLIRSFHHRQIYLSTCSRLKFLGIHADSCYYVNSSEGDHPLEHLWIFIYVRSGNYQSLVELLKRLPRVSRVTVELRSSISAQERTGIIQNFQRNDFTSIGMNMRPPVHGDSVLVIERSPHQEGG